MFAGPLCFIISSFTFDFCTPSPFTCIFVCLTLYTFYKIWLEQPKDGHKDIDNDKDKYKRIQKTPSKSDPRDLWSVRHLIQLNEPLDWFRFRKSSQIHMEPFPAFFVLVMMDWTLIFPCVSLLCLIFVCMYLQRSIHAVSSFPDLTDGRLRAVCPQNGKIPQHNLSCRHTWYLSFRFLHIYHA